MLDPRRPAVANVAMNPEEWHGMAWQQQEPHGLPRSGLHDVGPLEEPRVSDGSVGAAQAPCRAATLHLGPARAGSCAHPWDPS